ncbi:MAG TPA: lipocalin family protein [Rhodopila sp.]|jgi:apolipoprotein D and lipocalin family protein|nr:lipocalin family protein [Rhodopila sp.]
MKRRFRYRSALLPALVVTGAAGLLVACVTQRPSGNAHVPEPAKAVDLVRYVGLWYEMGRYDNSFERGCEAVTADYAQRPDGLIQVVNACHAGGIDGRFRSVKGRARAVEGSQNAKLKVSFFGPFYFGNYWVLDHAVDYTWSIVGEPSGRYLWILTRDPSPNADVKDALVERARALGYDMTLFRYTRQPSAKMDGNGSAATVRPE